MTKLANFNHHARLDSLGRCVGILVFFGLIATSIGCDIETSAEGGPDDINNGGIGQDAISPDASGEPDSGDVHETRPTTALEQGFLEEPYGVGAGWFDYDIHTHGITPKPRVYRLALSPDTSALFRIESYYDDRGTSGYFRLQVQQVDSTNGQARSEPQALVLSENIKNGPVCVDLGDATEVDCARGEHSLVFRVTSRQVAAAGFAVANPTIINALHFSDQQSAKVEQGGFDSLEDAVHAISDSNRDPEWRALADARLAPQDGVLGGLLSALESEESSPALLQANADMQMVGWKFTPLQDGYSFEFSATCAPLALWPGDQVMPQTAQAPSATLSFEPGRISLVRLCGEGGPQVIDTASESYRGLWPDAYEFDLFVDTLGDTPLLRLAPGHMIWSSGEAEITDQTLVPTSLWVE